jgi:hypothetical protein
MIDFTKKVISLDEYRRFRETGCKEAIRQSHKDLLADGYWQALVKQLKNDTGILCNQVVSEETKGIVNEYAVYFSDELSCEGDDLEADS